MSEEGPRSHPSIRVWDALSRTPVPLPVRAEPGSDRPMMRLYVCGVTPYDTGHMGHAFTFLTFDLLVRWVEASGVRVRYVQNVTDVDDPLFERANATAVDWEDLARDQLDLFLEDMRLLGWRAPDEMPRVSDEIEGIRAAVDELHRRGFAYHADRTYFDSVRFPSYGALSHRSHRSMIRKLRDEGLLGRVGEGFKRSPLDFPLWRPSEPGEPAWESAHGPGRPGWHIECSAMALRHLGDQVDVHGGGRDLQFSHHESERAQSESLTGRVPFVRAWMHAGMVRYEGHKISKSLGNLVKVPEALERVPAAAVRLYLASHRYRRDWDFRWEGLIHTARLVVRIRDLLEVERGGGAGPAPQVPGGEGRPGGPFVEAFAAAMDDDLDTPRAIRALRAAVGARDAVSVAWMLPLLVGEASLT